MQVRREQAISEAKEAFDNYIKAQVKAMNLAKCQSGHPQQFFHLQKQMATASERDFQLTAKKSLHYRSAYIFGGLNALTGTGEGGCYKEIDRFHLATKSWQPNVASIVSG